MSTQFISRVERIGRMDGVSQNDIGPGSYTETRGMISAAMPGFIPFNSSDSKFTLARFLSHLGKMYLFL
jgi:hypothetical protein